VPNVEATLVVGDEREPAMLDPFGTEVECKIAPVRADPSSKCDFVSHNAARRDANPYNAARTRRVSAAGLAPTSGEIVTQIQSGG
jgi:hypothetical protein